MTGGSMPAGLPPRPATLGNLLASAFVDSGASPG